MPPRREEDVDEDLEDSDEGSDFNADEEDGAGAGPSSGGGGGKAKPAAKGKAKRGRGSAFVDDAAEEDAEEEEEHRAGGSKKAKKRNVFIDDIADVDDDDDEEEHDEDERDLIDDHDVLPDNEVEKATHQTSYRLLNRDREEQTEEELARYIEDRYKQYDDRGAGGDDDADAGAVGQQGLLPTLNDPKLWMVHCRTGREREACTQLLQKYYTMHGRGTPLMIKSCAALDHLKGYIYIEAEKEAHVRDAIRGLRTIFISKGVALVPLKEMVDAISVNAKAKQQLARDNWVRVRTGLYKDDLARVVDVDFAAQRATVRLLPRLDFAAMAAADAGGEKKPRMPFGRQPVVRPSARVFNAEEARQLGIMVQRVPGPDGESYMQIASHRFIAGYIERNVAIRSLMVLDGTPPIDELANYNKAAAREDEAGELSALMAALPSDGSSRPKATYVAGDKVKFTKGELQGLEATVTDVRDDGKVMVVPKIDGFSEAVDCEMSELRKFFRQGDRVKVINGQHAGEAGMLLAVSDDASELCVMISDTSRTQIKVFARDLTVNTDADTGVETLGEYQLHDLVQLDQTTAGVIIKIERATARVLTSESTLEIPDVRAVRDTDMQRKVMSRHIITTDQGGNKVAVEDYVTMVEGPPTFRGKGGTVAYIWRGTLFIRCRELQDLSGGFIAVRARACAVRGGAHTAASVARLAAGTPRMTPNMTPQSPGHPSAGGGSYGARAGYAPQSPLSASLRAQELRPPPPRMGGGGPGMSSGGGAGGGGGGGGHGGRGGGPGALVGKVVRVSGGGYSGYRGRVKQETETHVQIEFDALTRVGTVKKEQVRVEGAPGGAPAAGMGAARPGAPQARSGFGVGVGFGGGGGAGDRGGQHGSGETNMYGTRTPMHHSMTPMHHQGTGSATPMHPSMYGGDRATPYTPLHAANTPMDDNYASFGGPRTNEPDGRTPAGAGTAPLSAPTPGVGGYTPSAYTPALTPSGYGGEPAMTPGLPGPPPGPPPGGGGYGGHPSDTYNAAPTPGSGHDHHHHGGAPTPYVPASTPGVAMTPGAPTHHHMDAAPTPGGAGAGYGYTPAITPGVAATPGLPAHTPALTPGGGGGGDGYGGGPAATPGGAGGYGGVAPESFAHWQGVLVTLPGSDHQLAVVTSVGGPDGRLLRVATGTLDHGSGAWVADGAELSYDGGLLSLLPPSKKDRVKILGESDTASAQPGAAGQLIGIDSSDGIVKVDNTTDLVIIDMRLLGRMLAA
ncbi:hypothetical protein FOA52_000065 [Chlamydomonas sp. UWO 241]|nr:hypothetical protein FOA52_000065 [Chlamydomonas sp. UWO 241]